MNGYMGDEGAAMTFWQKDKREQMKELKQARFHILQYINYLDRFRCDNCSGRVQTEGVYIDKTKCDCEAARKIRELGQVLFGNKQKIIEKFRELRKVTMLEALTAENFSKKKYLDLKAQGLTDKQIQEKLGWHSVKFNQWKRKRNLVGQRQAPSSVSQTIEKSEDTKGKSQAETVIEEPVLSMEEAPFTETVEPSSSIKDAILKTISEQIDAQTKKGVGKYSHTLDDCPPDKYDWQTMIIEELIDALQYQQKDFRRKQVAQGMTLNSYQDISKRTAKPHDLELLNYGLGISGEAGEVSDLIKKSFFQGHEIPEEVIVKELGDVLWYLSQIARLAGSSLEEVAAVNIEKLQRRYPNGFSYADSINRSE